MRSVEVVLALVIGASLVAALASKAKAPAPSFLVIAGVLSALIPGVPAPRLTPDLVLLVVLPPLLSAAAEDQTPAALRANWRPIVYLAGGLVVVSAALTALVAAPLLGVAGPVALVLGTILASTDPVAVTALARRMKLPERLGLVVQAESLGNDATSLVLFGVGVELVTTGGGVHPLHVVEQLLRLGGGGAVIGGVIALGAAWARGRSEDLVIQTVLALITPYAAYVAADAFGTSGVTAVVVAGVLTGARATRQAPARARLQLEAINETIVFLLESVIFALIGLQLPTLVRDVGVGAAGWLLPALALTATVVIVRFLGVMPLVVLVRRHASGRVAGPTGLRAGLVMTWAGTRGVVPLAAALSIPLTTASGDPFPARALLVLVSVTVVCISLVLQGLTLAPLTQRAGVVEPPELTRSQAARARGAMLGAARDRLQDIAGQDVTEPSVLDDLRSIQDRRERAVAGDGHADEIRNLRIDLLLSERAALDDLHREGEVSDSVWRDLRRVLDRQISSLER